LPAIATASLNTTTGDDRPLRLIALVQDYWYGRLHFIKKNLQQCQKLFR
jgi:hypothetical protein